jgi:hypothetical protein
MQCAAQIGLAAEALVGWVKPLLLAEVVLVQEGLALMQLLFPLEEQEELHLQELMALRDQPVQSESVTAVVVVAPAVVKTVAMGAPAILAVVAAEAAQ